MNKLEALLGHLVIKHRWLLNFYCSSRQRHTISYLQQ